MLSKRVAVTSRSFSRSLNLRDRLDSSFTNVKFNQSGVKLVDSELVNFLQGAECAIIGLEKIDDSLLAQLPDLQFICKVGTGVDKVDLNALRKRNIKFCATPGVNKRSVSELVLGLIFSLQRHLIQVSSDVKHGVWRQPAGRILSGKTIGIVGFGAIGRDLAKLLNVFDCECLIYDVQECHNLMPHVKQVPLKELLSCSDIISLHIPYLPENHHFIAEKELVLMKENALLINSARGGLIDELALCVALENKKLGGAALDVFEEEPKVPKRLLDLDNFIATSHIAGSTYEAINSMGMSAVEKLEEMVSSI